MFKLQIDVGPSAVPPKQPGKKGGEEWSYSALRAHKGSGGCTVTAGQCRVCARGLAGVYSHTTIAARTVPPTPASPLEAPEPGYQPTHPRASCRNSLGWAMSLDGDVGGSREGESCTSDQFWEPKLLPHPKQVAWPSRTAPRNARCHTQGRGRRCQPSGPRARRATLHHHSMLRDWPLPPKPGCQMQTPLCAGNSQIRQQYRRHCRKLKYLAERGRSHSSLQISPCQPPT